MRTVEAAGARDPPPAAGRPPDRQDPWSGVYLDLREDGTLGGFDGCNDFSGHWTVEGDRLTVTQLKGAQNPCPPDSDTGLQVILDAGPTVGVPADGSADLELRSPSGVVTFDRAEGSKALTDTELMVDLDGGDVAKVTFRTPRTVAPGSERMLARWTAVTSSEQPVSVWAAVAIEGLPEDCQLEGVARWEQLGDDIAQGRWDSYPRMNLEPGQGGLHRRRSTRRAGRVRRRVHAGPAHEHRLLVAGRGRAGAGPDHHRLNSRSDHGCGPRRA